MRKTIRRLFRSNALFTIGIIICMLWILAAIFAPWIAPYDPIEQDLTVRLKAPSGDHWFGTAEFGGLSNLQSLTAIYLLWTKWFNISFGYRF